MTNPEIIDMTGRISEPGDCDQCADDIPGFSELIAYLEQEIALDNARGIDRECDPLDDAEDNGSGRRQSKWEGGL